MREDFVATFARQKSLSRCEPAPTYAQRVEQLRALESLLLGQGDALVSAMRADFRGRARHESESLDILPALAEVRAHLRQLRGWMAPRNASIPWYLRPARARVVPQQLGVVGIISPWNFPVYLALSPLASALAAGNRVLLKPSELAPHTSALLGELLGRAFSADQLSVVLGGAEVGEAFSALPFDHLLFTGSTSVGRKVALAAAANLTPVTLELGGKSPVIIAPSANLAQAARRTMFGKLANAGQICIAPDYVLVPNAMRDELVALLKRAAEELYPDSWDSPEYTSILTPRHQERLSALCEDARAKGAEIVPLGARSGNSVGDPRLAPVLIVNPPSSARVMQEEIFGPILPVLGYDTLDEALARVARGERPLALYLFAEDARERDEVLQRTASGGVTVNDVFYHCGCGTLPFGGIGPSGMGAYHGKAGFDTFSHLRPVFYQTRANTGALLEPPTSPWKSRLRGLLKHIV